MCNLRLDTWWRIIGILLVCQNHCLLPPPVVNAQDDCFTQITCEACLYSQECEWVSYTNCLDGDACTLQSVTQFCRQGGGSPADSDIVDPDTYSPSNSTNENAATTCERARQDLVCQTAQTGCEDCLATKPIDSSNNNETGISNCEWRAGVCATKDTHQRVGRPALVNQQCLPCSTYSFDCFGCLNAGCFYNYFYQAGLCESQLPVNWAGDYFSPSTRNEETCDEAARISTCKSLTDCESCTSLQWNNKTRSCTWKVGQFDGQTAQCCTDNCTITAHHTTKTCSACEIFESCSTCLNAGCSWDSDLKCTEGCSATSRFCDSPPSQDNQINSTCTQLQRRSCRSKTSCKECTNFSFEQDDKTCGWDHWLGQCSPQMTSEALDIQHVAATTCESCEVFQNCEDCLASTAGCSWEVSTASSDGACKQISDNGAAFRQSTTTPIAETCRMAETTPQCLEQTSCSSCLSTTTTDGHECVWSGTGVVQGLCCTEDCLGVTTQRGPSITMTTECKFCTEFSDCQSCLDNDMFDCMWWHDNKCTEAIYYNDIEDLGPSFKGLAYAGYNNSLHCYELELSLQDIDTCSALDDCKSCNSANLHVGACIWHPNATSEGLCCTGYGCCDYPTCDEPLGERATVCDQQQVDCSKFGSCQECLGTHPASNHRNQCKWSASQLCLNECTVLEKCYELEGSQDVERIPTICMEATQSAPPSSTPSSPATVAPVLPLVDSTGPTLEPLRLEPTAPSFDGSTQSSMPSDSSSTQTSTSTANDKSRHSWLLALLAPLIL